MSIRSKAMSNAVVFGEKASEIVSNAVEATHMELKFSPGDRVKLYPDDQKQLIAKKGQWQNTYIEPEDADKTFTVNGYDGGNLNVTDDSGETYSYNSDRFYKV